MTSAMRTFSSAPRSSGSVLKLGVGWTFNAKRSELPELPLACEILERRGKITTHCFVGDVDFHNDVDMKTANQYVYKCRYVTVLRAPRFSSQERQSDWVLEL